MPFINRVGSGANRKFGFNVGQKPGSPTGVTGTAGNAQVSVAFTAPSNLGTATISYTATSSPGSFTATGSSSPLVVTGLSNGTAYTFTVTASNSFGSSASTASSSVTPVAPPFFPPCFSSCTPNCGSLTLSSTTVGGGSCYVPGPAPGCSGLGRCWNRDFYSYSVGSASCTDACGNVTTITCTSPYPTGVDSTVASGCCSTC